MVSAEKSCREMVNTFNFNLPSVGDLKAWHVFSFFPGIDPLMWLSAHFEDAFVRCGCQWRGKASLPLDHQAYGILYGKLFRKDGKPGRDASSSSSGPPAGLIGSIVAARDKRSQAMLNRFGESLEKDDPDIVVLEVQVGVGMTADLACETLTNMAGDRKVVLWKPVSLRSLRVPCDGNKRWFFAATRKGGVSVAELAKFASEIVQALAPTCVQNMDAKNSLLSQSSAFWQFRAEMSRRAAAAVELKAKATMKRKEARQLIQDGKEKADDEQLAAEPTPADKKRPAADMGDEGDDDASADEVAPKKRPTKTLPDLVQHAVKSGWLPSDQVKLVDSLQAAYDLLPKQSPLVYVHAMVLQTRAGHAYADGLDASCLGAYMADASLKRFNVARVLPPLSSSSQILCMTVNAQGQMSMQMMVPEEVLAAFGYTHGSIQLHLVKTYAPRMLVEATPVSSALLMLAIGAKLCFHGAK